MTSWAARLPCECRCGWLRLANPTSEILRSKAPRPESQWTNSCHFSEEYVFYPRKNGSKCTVYDNKTSINPRLNSSYAFSPSLGNWWHHRLFRKKKKKQGAAPVVETAPPHRPSLGDLIHPGNCDRIQHCCLTIHKSCGVWNVLKMMERNTIHKDPIKSCCSFGIVTMNERYQETLPLVSEHGLSQPPAVLFCVCLGAPHLAYSKRPKCRRPESPLPLPQRTWFGRQDWNPISCNGIGRQATFESRKCIKWNVKTNWVNSFAVIHSPKKKSWWFNESAHLFLSHLYGIDDSWQPVCQVPESKKVPDGKLLQGGNHKW